MSARRTGDRRGPLRRVLQDACAAGVSMDAVTVLAIANDPYRQDTPAGHADARWFARHFTAAIESRGKPTLHLRGVHYAIVAAGRIKKPNGKPYRNTDDDWTWLQSGPAKAARWLGYVPFTAITDNRADAPTLRAVPVQGAHTFVTRGQIEIPTVDDVRPTPGCYGFESPQPYRLVIFGEKSSLSDVVTPIAAEFDADLFLETGEISDSHIYQMAAAGAADGRPMRVFTLADCDPAGWQMPVSIARKLQALRDLEFPDLDFEVIPVALLVDHVKTMGLPSTPLKATEKRADKWRAAFGTEQTEIDALATLNPRALADLLRAALAPFYDHTLAARVALAEQSWRRQAQAAINTQVDAEELDAIAADVETFQAELVAVNERLALATADIVLPPVELPEPAIDPTQNGHQPLIASAWDWTEQTRRLKAWKAYEIA